MASTKISALPGASTLTGAETIPLVQGGTTKKVTSDQFLIKDGSGNVGVGTASPACRLNIAGYSSATTAPDLLIQRTSTGVGIQSSPNITFQDDSDGTRTVSVQNTQGRFGVWNYNAGWKERLCVDNAGNLGLGVTPSAWVSGYRGLEVGTTLSLVSRSDTDAVDTSFASNAFRDASGNWVYKFTGEALRYSQTAAGHQWYTAPSGTAGNPISFTQAMTLDASGNLGVGGVSGGARIEAVKDGAGGAAANTTGAVWGSAHSSSSGPNNYGFAVRHTGSTLTGISGSVYATQLIASTANSNALEMYTTGATPLVFGTNAMERARIDSDGDFAIGGQPTSGYRLSATKANGNILMLTNGMDADVAIRCVGGVSLITPSTGVLAFGTNNTERARIDASGNLLVGTTSVTPARSNLAGVAIVTGGNMSEMTGIGGPAFAVNRSTNDGDVQRFYRDGTQVGSVSVTSTTATYNTSSDARLKENIAAADNGSALIDSLQVRKFDWKSDGSHQRYGFVAQELDAVYPEAVSKPADPDEMMGVDYSKLVPLLVQEIQSLRARVAALETV